MITAEGIECPPVSNDPFGRATVRLIGGKHGEPSPSVSMIYQIRAVGAKRRSHQAQSRFAWI